MRLLGVFLLIALSACEPPVASHREEVPLRLFRWSEDALLPPEVLPGEPLLAEVHLYRTGLGVQAHLRLQGGLPSEGDWGLLLEEGERVVVEAMGEGRVEGGQVAWFRAEGRAENPVCAWWMVSFSPDPRREDEREMRLYNASGRVCEG
ncbi:hypothetical protein, partial [Thermus sp. FJN-A]